MSVDVLATLHIADVARDPRMRVPTILDWRKVPRYFREEWPRPVPPRYQVHQDAGGLVVGRALDWFEQAQHRASVIALDTEFDARTRRLWLLGMGYPEMDEGLQVWSNGRPHEEICQAVSELVQHVPTVFHNAVADLPILWENLGVEYTSYCQIEDTMLAHALLWSDLPHELEFLASLYSVYPKMKHLARVDPGLYNWGDVLDTLVSWLHLRAELEADPATERLYRTQSLPLIPLLIEHRQRGLAVNRDRVEPARQAYQARMEQARQLARAATGIPTFNIGSAHQVSWWLYQVEGLGQRRHRKTRQITVDEDALAALRAKVGPIPGEDEPETYEGSLERIQLGAHPVIEARVLYMAAQQVLSHYIAPLYAST